MNTQEQAMGLLKELADNAEKVKWHPDQLSSMMAKRDPSAKAFMGKVEGWNLLVVSFSTEDQGRPVGSRGYDGTGVRVQTPVVLRLTRDLAEKLFKLAEAACAT